MASAAAARSIFRSCSGSARGAAARLAPQATSTAKTARSPFRIPTKNSLSNSALRCPVQTSFLCGVNAAIPHCDCIGFDDINALNLWRHLRLAPRCLQ
ncbi:hypothetical protein RGQ29_027950 [Quercus rubra]|uniref:Uncharacterized protein n=1 Tax=Quercus rubra TaxID=3512 RepID=A0AAN7IM09_QUERU|nr:hypothetical protein RGQ29_027950 [Quercus rubra]KAK4577642.1 hypothetical protein RGQ29_027950 [Quercus rubra]